MVYIFVWMLRRETNLHSIMTDIQRGIRKQLLQFNTEYFMSAIQMDHNQKSWDSLML